IIGTQVSGTIAGCSHEYVAETGRDAVGVVGELGEKVAALPELDAVLGVPRNPQAEAEGAGERDVGPVDEPTDRPDAGLADVAVAVVDDRLRPGARERARGRGERLDVGVAVETVGVGRRAADDQAVLLGEGTRVAAVGLAKASIPEDRPALET